MKNKARFGIILVALLVGVGLAAAEKPSPDLERWLEDVSPIITKAERAVYSKLQTNADRTKFVRFFWRTRDPLPDTTQNEFQKEYEERIRYADQNFGHYSPKRGSRTERGFYYVLLGKPLERTSYSTQSQLWPLELWFYKGDEEYGLPAYFYLIFYQPEGLGDFRLYSPTMEGPGEAGRPDARKRRGPDAAQRARRHQGHQRRAGEGLPELPPERHADGIGLVLLGFDHRRGPQPSGEEVLRLLRPLLHGLQGLRRDRILGQLHHQRLRALGFS